MKFNNKYWLATITVIVVAVLLVKFPKCLATYLTSDYSIDASAIQRELHSLQDKVRVLQISVDDLEWKARNLQAKVDSLGSSFRY